MDRDVACQVRVEFAGSSQAERPVEAQPVNKCAAHVVVRVDPLSLLVSDLMHHCKSKPRGRQPISTNYAYRLHIHSQSRVAIGTGDSPRILLLRAYMRNNKDREGPAKELHARVCVEDGRVLPQEMCPVGR